MPLIAQDAVDYVVDPVTTGRTKISELDNVEKTFVGLKVEHLLRSFLGVQKGLRDLVIDGVDVDIKNTVGNTWTIPPESYTSQEPLLLVMVSEKAETCSLGLILAKEEYLNVGKNRDAKKAISKIGKDQITWLVKGQAMPDSRWKGLNMDRFRQLREMPGGTLRASTFFSENLGRPVARAVLQSLLHDQLDFMKRIRGNGGARDKLMAERIAIFSGSFDNSFLVQLGHAEIGRGEHMALLLSEAQFATYMDYVRSKKLKP